MASWEHVAWTLRDGTRIGPVSCSQFECTAELNGWGSWSGTVTVGYGATDRNVARSLNRGRTCIMSFRDGRFVNAGIIWRSQSPLGSGEIQLAGANLGSYLDHRLIGDLTFDDVPQFEIIDQLVDISNYLGFGIGLTASEAITPYYPRLRDLEWLVQDGKFIGEAITEIAGMSNGPDVTIDVQQVGEHLERYLRVWNPRAGRTLNEKTSPKFQMGANVVEATISTDATQTANFVVATGEGEGVDRLYITVLNVAGLADSDLPLFDAVIADSTVRKEQTLIDRAEGYLAAHDAEYIEPLTATVLPDHELSPWWSWRLGDDCYLIAATDDPIYGSPERGKPATIWPRRITAINWSVSSGDESCSLALDQPWPGD